MNVHTASGEFLGVVTEIVPSETDVWVVENDDSHIYIPYTSEDVLSVSLKTGIIVPDE